MIVGEVEEGVGVVEENVGVEYVVFHVLQFIIGVFGGRQTFMPLLNLFVAGGQLTPAGIEKVIEDAEQIEIYKIGSVAQQERPVKQHLLERHKQLFQLL